MIIGELIDYLSEIYDSLVSSKETLEAKNQKEVKPSGRTTALSSGLGYVVGGVYLLIGELLKSSLSSPKSIATIGVITPPIVSTVVFGLGVLYHGAQLLNMIGSRNPHPPDSREYHDWFVQRQIKISAHITGLSICALFLASSLTPIPGMSNGLGVALLSLMASVSLADKAYAWAKKTLATKPNQIPSDPHDINHTNSHKHTLSSSFSERVVIAPPTVPAAFASHVETNRNGFGVSAERSALDKGSFDALLSSQQERKSTAAIKLE